MRSERAVISNDIVRYGVSCIAEAYVTHHRHPFVLQTPVEAFHWTVDAPMSRAGDWHRRGLIKSMDRAHGRCSVLGISGTLSSIALHQFVCRHRFSCADRYAYAQGLLSTEHCLLHVSHHGLICALPFSLMMLAVDLHHRAMPGPLHFLNARGYHLQLPAVLQPYVAQRQTGYEGYWHTCGSVYPVIRPVHSALLCRLTRLDKFELRAMFFGLFCQHQVAFNVPTTKIIWVY